MKKYVLAFCALPLLTFAACSPDEEDSSFQTQSQPAGSDGIYAPEAKILTILTDGSPSQQWFWEQDRLQTVAPFVEGQPDLQAATTFEYENGRIKTVRDSASQTVYSYSNGFISSLSVSHNGEPLLEAVPRRAADGTVGKLQVRLPSEAIASFVSASGMAAKRVPAPKALEDGIDAEVLLSWDNGNVVRTIVNASVDFSFPLSALLLTPMMDSLLEASPELQTTLAFMGDAQINATLVVADTADFSFDAGRNPFFGYPGGLDVEFFSRANLLSRSEHGTARLVLPDMLRAVMQQASSDADSLFSFPMQGISLQYSYTYNAAGFPLSKEGAGQLVEYVYAE